MNEVHLEELLAAAAFTGARVSGLMVFCPFLGSEAVPVPVKAGLALLLTVVLHPLHGPATLALGSWQWAQVALGEAAIGLVLGLVANFLFEAALMAGQILGVQIGYSLANVFDPQTQADTPVLSVFHQMAALLIFLQMDVHHWLLRSLVRSFAYLPPGTVPVTLAAATGLLHAAGGIFLVGVQIAAPSLVATLVTDMALGFLGKAFAAASGLVHRPGGKKSGRTDCTDGGNRVLATNVQPALCGRDSKRGAAATSGALGERQI
jgi:flagellar biosynthetic protein FliR